MPIQAVTVQIEELPPSPGGWGFFSLRTRSKSKKWVRYGFREVFCEIGGRGFIVVGGDEPYAVQISDDGSSCECLGFLSSGWCRHYAGLLVVCDRMKPTNFDRKGNAMAHLKSGLPELPEGMKNLPVAENGYPVPWFTPIVDGKPDFRAADGNKIVMAIKQRRCWICGKKLPYVGQEVGFVVGPMASLNQISAEPPSHLECARFAVRACPFLARPHAKRRTVENMAEGFTDPPGIMLDHNPGVTAIWFVTDWVLVRGDDQGGILFHMEQFTTRVEWYTEGRPATRQEVKAAIQYSAERALEKLKCLNERKFMDDMVLASDKYLPVETSHDEQTTGETMPGLSLPAGS